MDPEELLEHVDFVQSLARSLVSDIHQAADVEQQTWLAALEHPPDRRKPIRLWLSRVAINFARRMYRSEKIRTKHEKTLSGIIHITSPFSTVWPISTKGGTSGEADE